MLENLPPRKQRQAGFNLIELLVVLLVGGLLLGVALPAGQGMLDRSRLIGATNEVYATLMFARNEATRRRADFSVCAISNAGSTSCSDSSQPFLRVFVGEGTSLATGRTNPLELTSPARVSVNNVDNNRLVFERLGNRKAGSNANQPVTLEVSVGSQRRTIDVCFNGRIIMREPESDQSRCIAP